jgi:hypothetical protein
MFGRSALAACMVIVSLGTLCRLHPALPQTQSLKGGVLEENGTAIPNALCTLTGHLLPAEGVSLTAGAKGDFEFPSLLPGIYALTCAAEGHEPVSQRDLMISDSPPAFLEIVLPLTIRLHRQIEVRETAPTVAQQSAEQPARLSAPQLMTLPLVEQKFKAALPLTPGVVRTPDGKINIKGVEENQSLLLVNGAETVDPVTGAFAVDLPVIAVESLSVYKTGYRPEYGGFSGGLTSVRTRPPSEKWHFEAQNLTPNPRIKSGHIVGIADFNPSVYVSRPLIPGRLSFSETVAYNMDKQPVRGLAWPDNETNTWDFTSFTTFQYVFSPQHLLTANVNVFPLRRQFANINSLVPQSASSDYGQKGFSVQAEDHYLFPSGAVLSTLVQAMQFDSNAHGQGPDLMLVTPNGWDGHFFNTYRRTSSQQEALLKYQFAQEEWYGEHQATAGIDFLHRSFTGTSQSHPVSLTRADGTLAEQISFVGPGSMSAAETEVSAFIQDHWVPNDRLALDGGLRYSGQTLGSAAALAPRIGAVFSPGKEGRTIIRGGVGLFYDHPTLLSGDFTNNPTRVVSQYDVQGVPLGPPLVYHNAYSEGTQDKALRLSGTHLYDSPFSVTWNVEADRQFSPRLLLRVGYISSRTYNTYVVSPTVLGPGDAALLLSSNGGGRYHEFEATLHFRASEAAQFSVSYINSLARGDLNTLNQVYVPFEQPVIRPNAFGFLPSHIPNRIVGWGMFPTHIWKIFAGPVVDFHTGFPYSYVDVLQNYVGPANSHRFPRFFALDLKLGKEFTLPLPYLRQHRMRGSLTILNLTNHSNPRDVYNNIASPYFGDFAGFQHRWYDTQLDIIY